jgi:uncharacterized protein (PEP-CTERM system associated)
MTAYRGLITGAVGSAVALGLSISPALPVEWTTTYAASSSVSGTSNANLAPSGQEEAALTGRVSVSTFARARGNRLNFTTDSSLSLIRRTDRDRPTVDQSVHAVSTIELFSDKFFVDANFASTRELVSSTTPITGGDAATDETGRVSITSLSVSPYWQQRYGRWAQSLVRYRHTEVIAGSQANDSRNDAALFQLVGGQKLSPWRPSLVADWSNKDERSSGGRAAADVMEYSVGFGNQFALSRLYSVSASVGYQKVDSAIDSRDLSGFVWSVGAIGRPGPRTSFDVSVGTRYGELAINGTVRHAITDRLTLRLEARQNYGTGAQRLVTDASLVTVNPTTGALETPAGLPVGFGDTGVDAALSIDQIFLASLVGVYGRNRVTITGSVEQRQFDVGTETIGLARGVVTRALGPRASVSVSGFYRTDDSVLGVVTDTINGRVDLSYQIGQHATVFGGYSYTQRFTDIATGDYSEHVGTIGGRVTF